MESNTNNTGKVQNDELSLKELILRTQDLYYYLCSKWKIILSLGIIGGVLGFAYAHFKEPVYTATCSFVLDEGKGEGGLSQYAGLAAMAGINIGGASDGLFQGDNIIELYKSRSMLQKTLLSYGEFDGTTDLLINRYIKINKLREKWAASRNSELKNLSFNISIQKFTRLNDSVMNAIVSDIKKNYLAVAKADKNLSIIEVEVKSKDEQFAKVFNDAVVATVNQFYVETKTKKSTYNLHILQRQADSIRIVLNRALSGTASAADANPNANMALQILRVPSQRKQVDVQANSAMYAEIVKNLELAKLNSRQETPLIQLVDEPVYPIGKEKIGHFRGAVFGVLLLSLLATFLLTIKFLLKSLLL